MSGVYIAAMTLTEDVILDRLGVKKSIQGMNGAKIFVAKESTTANSNQFEKIIYAGGAGSLGERSLEHTHVVLHINELEQFADSTLNSAAKVEKIAARLLERGAQNVLVIDYCPNKSWSYDLWMGQQGCFWLSQPYRLCDALEIKTFYTTSLSAFLALNFSLLDSVVLASMYINQAIRCGDEKLFVGTFPENQTDLPYVSRNPLHSTPESFPPSPKLGLYPIVEDLDWMAFLLQAGVKTIQLRIKGRSKNLSQIIAQAIKLANNYQALLFINDHWDLALQYGARAVHLGQEDLAHADLSRLREQGIILGVSTYSYVEVARAHAINPSYIAIGPIYETSSKDLSVPAQGIEGLKRWCRTLKYPLVAIGGISTERATAVAATGVAGIALISAITEADDPALATRQLLEITS
ncbi:MAG: thiamine-phosphate diphosphorylase [Legionella sp. 40-6]|nr:thiamine phosphate synthase [Legionella sp.]OJY17303.1 MAG: thiamine-phosphate diphosphorylase [Legionella sp. 40-6]